MSKDYMCKVIVAVTCFLLLRVLITIYYAHPLCSKAMDLQKELNPKETQAATRFPLARS